MAFLVDKKKLDEQAKENHETLFGKKPNGKENHDFFFGNRK